MVPVVAELREKPLRQWQVAVLAALALANSVDIRPKSGAATPLMIAAAYCGDRAGKVFLDAGAEVNAVHNSVGGTALVRAVWENCPQMVDLLLDVGADPMPAAKGRKVPEEERGFRALDFARKHNPELLPSPAGRRLERLTEAGKGCDGAPVEAGDFKHSILAERVLGDPSRWKEIAEVTDLGAKGYRKGDRLALP